MRRCRRRCEDCPGLRVAEIDSIHPQLQRTVWCSEEVGVGGRRARRDGRFLFLTKLLTMKVSPLLVTCAAVAVLSGTYVPLPPSRSSNGSKLTSSRITRPARSDGQTRTSESGRTTSLQPTQLTACLPAVRSSISSLVSRSQRELGPTSVSGSRVPRRPRLVLTPGLSRLVLEHHQGSE